MFYLEKEIYDFLGGDITFQIFPQNSLLYPQTSVKLKYAGNDFSTLVLWFIKWL